MCMYAGIRVSEEDTLLTANNNNGTTTSRRDSLRTQEQCLMPVFGDLI